MINNTVIEVLDREHGKKVIQYFKSQGVDTRDCTGICSKQSGALWRYYGVVDGYFSNWDKDVVNMPFPKVSVIQLPQQLPQRGDRILVWDNQEQQAEVVFLTYIEGAKYPVISVLRGDEDEFTKGSEFDVNGWKNWKPISTEQIVELTIEDISNGKGTGIPPHLIRIKK